MHPGCQSVTDQLIGQSVTDQLIDQSTYSILQKPLELPARTEEGRKLCEPQLNCLRLGPEAALGEPCAEIRILSQFSVASSQSHMEPQAF